MSTARTFVIVGGGVAAAEAAKTLHAEGYADRLVVVTDEPRPPYERPPLTKEYLRGEAGEEKLVKQPRLVLRRGRHRAPDRRPRGRARRPGPDAGARRRDVDRFDRLLLATGARAVRPRLDGRRRSHGRTSSGPPRTPTASARRRAGRPSAVVAGGGLDRRGDRGVAAPAGARRHARRPRHRGAGAPPGRRARPRARRPPRAPRRPDRPLVAGRGAPRTSGGRREVVLDTGEILATDLAVLGLGAVPGRRARLRGRPRHRRRHPRRRAPADRRPTGCSRPATSRRRGTPGTSTGSARRTGTTPDARGGRRRGTCSAWRRSTTACRTSSRTSSSSAWRSSGAPISARTCTSVGRTRGVVAAWTRDGVVVAGAHTNAWDSRKPLDRLIASGAVLDVDGVPRPGRPARHPRGGAGLASRTGYPGATTKVEIMPSASTTRTAWLPPSVR